MRLKFIDVQKIFKIIIYKNFIEIVIHIFWAVIVNLVKWTVDKSEMIFLYSTALKTIVKIVYKVLS